MTARTMLICNGVLPGRSCRMTLRTETKDVFKAREEAAAEGWSSSGWRDYCPACTRRRKAKT